MQKCWRRIHDEKINLTINELMPELKALRDEHPVRDADFPFVLSAGQRRSSTANTIIRDPNWRPKDPAGALWMNPADASELGIENGGRVRITTKRASAESVVVLTGHDDAGTSRCRVGPGCGIRTAKVTGISAWRRAQRAHGNGGSRLVRRHAVSQACARANRGGRLMRRTRFDRWPRADSAKATSLVGDWWTPLAVMRGGVCRGRDRLARGFQRSLKFRAQCSPRQARSAWSRKAC